MTARSLASLALLVSVTGCGEKIQEEYKIQIVGPLDKPNFLEGATTGVLEAGGKEYRSSITPGAPFSVSGAGIKIGPATTTVFRFRALDASGGVVAQGESPEMELVLATPPLVRLFVQRPGSFGRTFDLDYPRRELVAAAVRALPEVAGARPVPVILFGLGRVTVPDTTAPGGMAERPSEVYALYNPINQFFEDAGMSAAVGGLRQPRTDAMAVVYREERILMFGGLATPPTMASRTTGQLDVFQVLRSGFDEFVPVLDVKNPDRAEVPRSRGALVELDLAYAIGGRSGDQVLDTVVSIDPAQSEVFKLVPARMAGPREGHTATVAAIQTGGKEVLIFGGAAPTVPVAEVMVVLQAGPMFLPVTGNVGPPRRDHSAVTLPGGDRVIVIGGRNDAGVLGDSVLYLAQSRMAGAGPIALRTPRHSATTFIVGNDLVVAGGLDANNVPIGDAEVFDTTNLMPRAVVECSQRSGAAVAVLPNRVALLLGGTTVDGKPTSVSEIYQPHVTR